MKIWSKNRIKKGARGKCEKMHHDEFLKYMHFKSLMSEKVMLTFLHNEIQNQSKFCFQKCLCIFFLWEFVVSKQNQIASQICYTVIWKKQYLILTCQWKQHSANTWLSTKIIEFCKPIHNFWEISNKHKMLWHFVNISSTIPTKGLSFTTILHA